MHNVMQFPCTCIIRKVKCLHVPFLSTNHMHVYLMHHSNNWGRSPPLVALVAILSVRMYGCMVLYTANALPVLFQRLSCKILQSRDDCSAPTMHCIY